MSQSGVEVTVEYIIMCDFKAVFLESVQKTTCGCAVLSGSGKS